MTVTAGSCAARWVVPQRGRKFACEGDGRGEEFLRDSREKDGGEEEIGIRWVRLRYKVAALRVGPWLHEGEAKRHVYGQGGGMDHGLSLVKSWLLGGDWRRMAILKVTSIRPPDVTDRVRMVDACKDSGKG